MTRSTAKVAIIGLGTIGTGVARLLLEQPERIARQASRKVELARIVVANKSRPRTISLPPGLLTTDLASVLNDPEIEAVVQVVGGLEPDRTNMLKLMQSGKDIITANKAVLAEHGPELFDFARKMGRTISFEAAVGGGIPVIAAINQSLVANQIESIHGILNGTSNFILTKMADSGATYADALAEAQRQGFAEADPAMDVNGSDAAQKLAILAHVAFGARVDWKTIPRIGIDTVDVADMRYARELGYNIKLLAVAELVPEGLELHVSPTLVRQRSTLAQVDGAFNAIRIVGDAVGRVLLHGLGAGQMPTASACIADLIDTLLGRAAITFRALNLWSDEREPPVKVRDPASVSGRFYVRFNVEDRPGVMADIAGVLGRHKISIASVIQHESAEEAGGFVPLVFMTHSTKEGAICDALRNYGTGRGRAGECEIAGARVMKYAIIIPDGCADEPQASLGGKTPLEAARLPAMDAVVKAGLIARGNHTPASLPAGSDTANLSLLGYDPLRYYTGRAPLEAAAQGIELAPGDWAVRCNLVTIEDQTMRDFTAGHVFTEEATALLAALQEKVGSPTLRFLPGVSYRNLLIVHGASFTTDTRTLPPHDFTDQSIADAFPRGPGSSLLADLMTASEEVFAEHAVNHARRKAGKPPVTNVWLWGQGSAPRLDPFEKLYRVRGAMITAVDLLRGLARLIGWRRIDVPGATGYLDTDYAAKGRYAAEALKTHDLVCVHVEATDEASHEGRADAKIGALEQIDRNIVAPLFAALQSYPQWRIMVSPDHPTPLRTKTHSHGDVPIAMAGSGIEPDGFSSYDDRTAARSKLHFPEGWKVMGYFIGAAERKPSERR